MIAAVIPAQNEEKNLAKVIRTLAASKIDLIIPILNGCNDRTKEVLSDFKENKLYFLEFPKPLGIDVPRPIGAKLALELGASEVLFIDGDMTGPILHQINQLIDAVTSRKVDMALTDCYQNSHSLGSLAELVLHFRKQLNNELGIYSTLGVASPSHGPHALSRKFLNSIPLKELAVPPVSLALAQMAGLKIGIATSIPHCMLGSTLRSYQHVEKIAETIIGDCIEAIEVRQGRPRTRTYNNQTFIGYHRNRDFLSLDQYLKS